MGNHYHLLAETPTGALSQAMHRINSGYAKHFNQEHETEGHLFERRYQSWVMGSQERAMEAVRYIVRNPVRAGLCVSPAGWPWSSHVATAGDGPAPPFLTVGTVQGWFGADAVQAVETTARTWTLVSTRRSSGHRLSDSSARRPSLRLR